MSDEKNESRINIEDLPQAEQELTAEDAKKVQGGVNTTIQTNPDPKKDKQKETISIDSFSWG